jgi:hypothetical protein
MHCLQEVQAIPDIIIDKFQRVFHGLTHQAIGGEMHYGLDGMGLKNLEEPFLICQVSLNQGGIFNCLPVPGLQVVVNNGLVAPAGKFLHHMAPDIARTAGYKDLMTCLFHAPASGHNKTGHRL